MVHWPSFVLGLAVVPILALVMFAVVRLSELARRQYERLQASDGLEPLRFTPRLIGQLRRPLEVEEDQARAS